jgi:CRP-like cAMP-binding protein
MLGAPALQRNNRALFTPVVRVPGSAMRVKSSILREALKRDGPLQTSLFLYMQTLLTQVAHSAVCNMFHRTVERLARWLLVMNDHSGARSNIFLAKHDFIAQMLGERRVSITQAAHRLREAEVISYGRGQMQIINRRRLEAAACSCYWLAKGQIRRG